METHCTVPEELSIITSSDLPKHKSSASLVAFAESSANLDSNLTTRFSLSSLHQTVSELFGPGRLCNGTDAVSVCSGKRKRIVWDCEVVPSSKRRLTLKFRDEFAANGFVHMLKGFQCTFPEVIFQMYDLFHQRISLLPRDVTAVNNFILTAPLIEEPNIGRTSCKLRNIGLLEGRTVEKALEDIKVYKETVVIGPDAKLVLPSNRVDDGTRTVPVKGDEIAFKSTINYATTVYYSRRKKSLLEVGDVDGQSKVSVVGVDGDRTIIEDQVEEPPVAAFCSCKEESANHYQSLNTVLLDKPHKDEHEMVKNVDNEDTVICIGKDKTSRRLGTTVIYPAAESSVVLEQLSECSDKVVHEDAMSQRRKPFCETLENDKAINDIDKKYSTRNRMPNKSVEKLTEDDCGDVLDEEKKRMTSISQKDNMENNFFPTFESYIVEEEEGSGGYGTVYRARRKNGGATVAIKCPHANAHRHHVRNEQRMLERFGGKNFVIKYEGCFKNGNTDCSVLEHVEHDRPEVLKKEIDVLQLQWYGYCIFKALASLHKQGITHRDVKPGNFLFSCKTIKGYLIDFNLAMDLHQMFGNPAKQKVGHDANIKNVKFDNAKSVLQTKDAKGSKSTLDQHSLRKKALIQIKANNYYLSNLNISKSQGADGSGITSARDATSTATPSAERPREPLPCHGRKELINLVQKARQNPKGEVSSVPSPLRKRVAASPGNVDSTLIYLTPMPLHSTLISLGVSGSMSVGDGKQKREGPCIGTKGFRAPEVLLRSPHQGPKMDTWSAGVTLLYLMIGRTPFVGDPEQNIKDIAKLRGSESLWEVAKLHNRESSFPTDLYKAEFLPSVKLRDWCELNTKRPDFFKKIPELLFDLVDKCLTVNPRLRISAEEALKHQFFAPCHEALRKQRLYRQTFSQGSISDSSSGDQNIFKQAKPPKLKA